MSSPVWGIDDYIYIYGDFKMHLYEESERIQVADISTHSVGFCDSFYLS